MRKYYEFKAISVATDLRYLWYMSHSIPQLLAQMFPDLEHPKYQSALETISFLVVTGMLIGSLAAAVALVVYEL